MNEVVKREGTAIDKIEHFLTESIKNNSKNYVAISCPLIHTFTPGIYSRQISMPAGSVVTSEIHLTQHQYVISEGVVEVWTEESGWKVLIAPFHGVTMPDTHRVLRVLMDTVWTTFHANPNDKWKTVEEVEDEILKKRNNPLLDGQYKNNKFITQIKEMK